MLNGGINGENLMLINGGNSNYTMRHYGRRRSRSRSTSRTSLQHSPASMGNVVLTNDQLIFFAVVADNLAGTSLGTSHVVSDRERECASGTDVNFITWDVGVQPTAGAIGSLQYLVFKVERSFVTPVAGTDPIPSDADVIGLGLQAAYRTNMPGWVMKFGLIPLTPETTNTKKITINLKKFRKSKVRSGDFVGISLFNDTDASVIMDIHCRYRQFT